MLSSFWKLFLLASGLVQTTQFLVRNNSSVFNVKIHHWEMQISGNHENKIKIPNLKHFLYYSTLFYDFQIWFTMKSLNNWLWHQSQYQNKLNLSCQTQITCILVKDLFCKYCGRIFNNQNKCLYKFGKKYQ